MAIGKGKRRIIGISSVGETATFFSDGEGPGVNKKVVMFITKGTGGLRKLSIYPHLNRFDGDFDASTTFVSIPVTGPSSSSTSRRSTFSAPKTSHRRSNNEHSSTLAKYPILVSLFGNPPPNKKKRSHSPTKVHKHLLKTKEFWRLDICDLRKLWSQAVCANQIGAFRVLRLICNWKRTTYIFSWDMLIWQYASLSVPLAVQKGS